MKKLVLPALLVLTLTACSTDPLEVPPPPPISTEVQPVAELDFTNPVLQGYIRTTNQLLDSGRITRDQVTVDAIQKGLPGLDDAQAEALRQEILK